MDIIDPLEQSEKTVDTVESKMMLNEIHIKAMESDEEGNVDHLSPQTLLETPDSEMQYSIRSPEAGVITYRVLQVDDGSAESVPQIVTTASTAYSNAAVSQVNINGQLYVIGSPNEVFTAQTGTRAIAPRSSIIESNSNVVSNIRSKKDERRRATHNEVERRRRDKINSWITKLATIIPDSSSNDPKGNGHYDGQSKGGILAKACDYISDLRDTCEKHEITVKENRDLRQNIEMMKARNATLERENRELKAILKKNAILYVPNDISS